MSGFFKIAIRNLLQGPTTDPYPFGETFLPDEYRGVVGWDKDTCIGCNTCEHVCPTGAIKVREKEDKSGFTFSYWMNTCTFCGNCAHFCPTGAVAQTTNFHTATVQKDKYKMTVQGEVLYVPCTSCGKQVRPSVKELLEHTYGEFDEEKSEQTKVCPECRRMQNFERLYT